MSVLNKNLLREFVKSVLLEKRRGATESEDRIEDEINTLQQYVDKGYFFHMTHDYRLQGVNIKTEFTTPIGIYFYPLTNEFYQSLLNNELPYASDRNYVLIYKFKGNVLKSSEYSWDDFKNDYNTLLGESIDDSILEELERRISVKHPMSALMYLVYEGKFESNNAATMATKKLLSLGYHGLYDDLGLGVIHKNEPTQAVVFSSKYCEVIDVIKNPFMLKVKSKFNRLNILPEDEQLAIIKQDWYAAIKHIKNPSERVQIAAVKECGLAIQFIKNPSERVQIAAVRENPFVIQYIKNPSEAVQLAAVKRHGTAIQFIKNPSEAVQLAADEQLKHNKK